MNLTTTAQKILNRANTYGFRIAQHTYTGGGTHTGGTTYYLYDNRDLFVGEFAITGTTRRRTTITLKGGRKATLKVALAYLDSRADNPLCPKCCGETDKTITGPENNPNSLCGPAHGYCHWALSN